MRILAVADVHGKSERLESIKKTITSCQVELLIVAGDLLARRHSELVENVLASLCVPVFLVRGNADSSFFKRMIERNPTFTDLHLNHKIVADIPFIGVGGAVPIPFYAKVQWNEKHVLNQARACLSSQSVLVTHTPPRGSADKVLKRFHAGSKALGNLVDQTQPRLVLCGHIHEDPGVTYRKNTCVVNCSMGDNGQGVLIDLEAGNGKIVTAEL